MPTLLKLPDLDLQAPRVCCACPHAIAQPSDVTYEILSLLNLPSLNSALISPTKGIAPPKA